MRFLSLAFALLPTLASAAPVQILVEGGHGGVSEPLPSLPVAASLSQALGDEWQRSSVNFGALAVDGGWIVARQGGLSSLHGTSGLPGTMAPMPLLVAEDWLLFAWPPAVGAKLLPELRELEPGAPPAFLLPAAAAADDSRVHLSLGDSPPVVPSPPTGAEARLRLVLQRADGAELHLVSRVRGEGSRRVSAQRLLDDGALRIAAGDVVEGRSFLLGQSLSLQRDVSWASFQREGLHALVPAGLELLPGIEALKEEARGAGVALVSSNLFDAGEHAVSPWLLFEQEGSTLLVLGWTPPDALDALDPTARGELSVGGTDVVLATLQEARAQLEAPPSAVLLVGLGDALPDLPGVDLALTDFGGDRRQTTTLRVDPELLAARRALPPDARDPLPSPRLGARLLGELRLELSSEGIDDAWMRVLTLPEDLPADAATRDEVQEVRQGVYVTREETLVPAPGRLPPPPGWRKGAAITPELDAPGFALLTGNLMIDRTGADIAFVPLLPRPLDIDGDRSELVVDSSLALTDEVVRLTLTGLELRQILLSYPLVQAKPGAEQPPRDGAWIVGSQAALFPRWRGSKLADGDILLVAMSDRLAADPRIAALVTKARVVERWSGQGWTRHPAIGAPSSGAVWPLRELVREGLERLRDKDPTFGLPYARRLVPLAADLAERVPSRLTFEVDDLNLGVSGSVSFRPDTGYEGSNESRAKLTNTVAGSARGRLALRWSDRIGEIEGFAFGTYAGSREAGSEQPIELADDLQLGGELRLRLGGSGQRLSKIPVSLYLQSVYDTEWTRQDDPDVDGGKLDLQRLLRTSAGLHLGFLGVIREAWLGGFVEADLSAEQGTFSPGIATGVRTEKRWGALRWSNLVDVRGYFPTAGDTEADLSLRAALRSDLVVMPLRKIVPGLAVGGFVDALIYRGAVPGLNTTPGLHLLVGAELSYDSLIRPPVRVR